MVEILLILILFLWFFVDGRNFWGADDETKIIRDVVMDVRMCGMIFAAFGRVWVRMLF